MIVDAVAKIVMELESQLPPSNVMDALFIMYPQLWPSSAYQDMHTYYMITLKATLGHPRNIPSVPLEYEIAHQC